MVKYVETPDVLTKRGAIVRSIATPSMGAGASATIPASDVGMSYIERVIGIEATAQSVPTAVADPTYSIASDKKSVTVTNNYTDASADILVYLEGRY